MKRKLKPGSIKGTPPITKFFKKNPGIKAKPLTAVVAISNISKSTVNDQCPESANGNNKLVEKVGSQVEVNNNKRAAQFEIIETNLLNSNNVNDLALLAEDIISKAFEAGELVSSSPKRKPVREGNTIRAGSDYCAPEQLSKFIYSAKRRIFSEKEPKEADNAESISETKIQNGCLNNTGAEDSNLSEIECKAVSTQRLEISNQKQLNSNSDNAQQHSSVTSREILNKESFSSDIRNSSTDKNTVNKHNQEQLDKNSLNTCTIKTANAPDDLDICSKQINNTDKELPEEKKSNPSLNDCAPCHETVASLNDNSCSDLSDAIDGKDALISLMEQSMEDGFGTELSDQLFLDAIDWSESKKDNTSGGTIKTDEKEISEDCLLELTECEKKMWDEMKMGDLGGSCDSVVSEFGKLNEKKVADLDVEGAVHDNVIDGAGKLNEKKISDLELQGSARDSVIDGVGKSESNDVFRTPTKETNYDSFTSAEEQSNNDGESSDEELFNPVAFLCDQRTKPDVKTPEKGVAPIFGSPLTPISPFVAQPRDAAGRLKYSLDKLLLEKPKQLERGKELARLQLAMQQTIEIGRNTRLADDIGKEEQDDDKTLLPIHQKELQKYSSTDKGFSERVGGENIFPGLREPDTHDNGCSQPFPAVEAAVLDEFPTFMYQRSDVEIRELLGACWITYRYLEHPCPQSVVQWLFHVLCYHVDVDTVKASYNALWSMLNLGDTHAKKSKELSWIPTAQDVLKVFNNYGADFTLVLRTVCQTMDIGENLLKLKSEKDLISADENEEQESSFFPLVNFTRLIQFITLCVTRYPQSYTTEDIEHLVLLLYCISLDIRMDICQYDMRTCLQAMYGAVECGYWMEEATKLSSVIYGIETHHRNKLRIVQMQPCTCKGRDVQRLAALQMFGALLANNIAKVEDFIRSDFDASKDTEITNNLELFKKLKMLLSEVRLNDDTDYYQLYTMIELLDIVIGAEYLPRQEKAIVEKITKKLRSFHSDIKDPRAMFISRSKVKDLILRTITKFTYMTQGQKRTEPQKSITKFFVEGKSNLHIETLKDSEIMEEDEEELASQESHASSLILHPLSQATQYSDDESQQGTQELP